MKARDYINNLKPNTVDNWSNQASLLSYGDVAELMDMYAELRLSIVSNSEAELKAKVRQEVTEEIRQWLIGEDYEGLAERL